MKKIGTIITLGTAHLRPEDLRLMETGKAVATPLSAKYEEGFFFYRPDTPSAEADMMEKAGFSREFANLIRWAFGQMGADILRIDADGDTMEGFPAFDHDIADEEAAA